MLSAKGTNLEAWGVAQEFTARYRDNMLEQAAFCGMDEAEARYAGTIAELDRLKAEQQSACERLDAILAALADATDTQAMRDLMLEYYGILYRQMYIFHSAPAFYRRSMALLAGLSASIEAAVTGHMGMIARRLPACSLVALGPAGRNEYSPFCPLQLMLVHDDVALGERETLLLYGRMLHEAFDEIGLRIDPVITPRNPEWCGSVDEWRHRLEIGLEHGDVEDLIELLRLADQHTLTGTDGPAMVFRRISLAALHGNRPAVNNLVERMSSLSNGLGLMGKMKLEKSGVERGRFRLLDHGLLPLSAAVSVLALVREVEPDGTPQRIRNLLAKRELNVDIAERMLNTWHVLHELRLLCEHGCVIDRANVEALYLDPEKLSSEQRHELHLALESVAAIQRYVHVIFAGAGE